MGICFYLWFRTLVIDLIMQGSFVSAWGGWGYKFIGF